MDSDWQIMTTTCRLFHMPLTGQNLEVDLDEKKIRKTMDKYVGLWSEKDQAACASVVKFHCVCDEQKTKPNKVGTQWWSRGNELSFKTRPKLFVVLAKRLGSEWDRWSKWLMFKTPDAHTHTSVSTLSLYKQLLHYNLHTLLACVCV